MEEWCVKDEFGKYLEGSGQGLILRYYACSDWGIPQNTWVRIASLQAEIWTRHLPNTKHDC
jgi:hypothetical protein